MSFIKESASGSTCLFQELSSDTGIACFRYLKQMWVNDFSIWRREI